METSKLGYDLSEKLLAQVYKIKRLTAHIQQLRHPNGSLPSVDQDMAQLPRATFLNIFREDEGQVP